MNPLVSGVEIRALRMHFPAHPNRMFHRLVLSTFRDNDFAERQRAAQEAKKALLSKFKSAPGPEDPAVQARLAERKRIADARAQREAEREAERQAKLAEEARLKAEREAAEAAAEAERLAALEAEKAAQREAELAFAARVIADEAARKAKRDARYAARKARQGR
jgi:hypothetical protein